MVLLTIFNVYFIETMVYTLIEHFLSDEGKQLLPTWITDINEVMKNFEGFTKLELLEDTAHAERTLLLIQFEKLIQLQEWAKSEQHHFFLKQLQPFMLRKQHSQLYKTA